MTVLYLLILFALTILSIVSLWHMDLNHNLDRLGDKKTRGIWHVTPDEAYRIAQYFLILFILLYDFFIAYLILLLR